MLKNTEVKSLRNQVLGLAVTGLIALLGFNFMFITTIKSTVQSVRGEILELKITVDKLENRIYDLTKKDLTLNGKF